MSKLKIPRKITSDNPYFGVAGSRENCTAWTTQVVKENSGSWYPQSNGQPCIGSPVKGNPSNETMWDTLNGYSKHYKRKNALIGQLMIFDNGSTGHVEVIIDITKNHLVTTSMNYGENNGAETFYHPKKAKSPHPVYKNCTLLGFRGTPASYTYQQKNK